MTQFKVGKTTGVAKKLAIMKSRLSRGSYDDTLTSFAKIGAKYWKRLTNAQKQNYISTMMNITKDNEGADPHLGDESFQAALIGSVPRYIEVVNANTSIYYKELEKRKAGKELTIEYPETLLNTIDKSTGSYRYTSLIQRDALYQINPEVEDSRARRYRDVKYIEKPENGINWTGKVKALPVHPEAKELIFKQLDLLWYGIEQLRNLPIIEQNIAIVEGLAPNTNAGYPHFKTQTKDNIGRIFWDWATECCPSVLTKYEKLCEYEGDNYLLSVDLIFDCVSYCDTHKIYEPSINFYRTQFTKVRSVFGGHVLFKALGAMVHAAKNLGYTVESCQANNVPVNKHWDKQLVSFGGLPIMAQLDWDTMFTDILNRMPNIVQGKLVPMTPAQLKGLFGFKSDKDLLVDVIGEDIKAYDTGVVREDLLFLISHKHLGFVMQYVINWLSYAEVWVGDLRLFDIFFKSGHPWTSDMGSFNHINMAFIIRDYIRKINGKCELLAFTVLSDDSLFWWVGFDMKLAVDCMKYYGYKIRDSASFVFSRDYMVSFLKVLVGYVSSESEKIFIGDFQSRYLKLAHSEREIEQDLVKVEKYKAEITGIYKITGDIEIDSFLSKLASLGRAAAAVILEILRIVKDTALGRSAIKVILSMRDDERYELYRSDVTYGFHPSHLAKLQVQSLLNSRLVPTNA